MAQATPVVTFWSHVDLDGPVPECRPDLGVCWLWTGRLDRDGYGHFGWKRGGHRTEVFAHRFAYEIHVGPFPRGLVTDHLCRVRACVNPAHLEPVTNAENIARGDMTLRGRNQRVKTHCKHGHEFTPENTRWRNGRWRICVTCARRRTREWMRANQ